MENNVIHKYNQGAVFGSLAYDYNNPSLHVGESVASPLPVARPQYHTQSQSRASVKPAIHSKQGIAPLSIIGLIIAAFLFVISITAQAQLISISSSSIELQNQLNDLNDQYMKLRIRYESAFNMSDIEEYAIHSLGMQKPKADQIFYIDTSAPNKAIVLADIDSASFVDRVSNALSEITNYFR